MWSVTKCVQNQLDTRVDKFKEGGYEASMVHQDFRLHLQHELVRRCKINPRYSLRAFARSIDMEPSFLSKILSGKRSITPSCLIRLSSKLGVSPEEIKHYQENHKDISKRGTWSREEMSFRDVTVDHFQVIADWYHYAILELITVKTFRPSPLWIAKTLGISVPETHDAIDRLVRLGFIEVRQNGKKWVNVSGHNTTVGHSFTATAFRQMQRQILEKALLALEEVPLEKRDQTTMTMAIDTSLLPQAKIKLKSFRRRLCKFLQKNEKKRDQVYLLSMSLFPATELLVRKK